MNASQIVDRLLESKPGSEWNARVPKKTLARWATMDPHEAAVEQAGGKHIKVPLNRDKFNAHLAAHAPGCGAPTYLEGTNGGQFPCGSTVNGKQEFCPACAANLQ